MNKAVQGKMRFLDLLTHEDGRSYGRNLDPWQREDLLAWFEAKQLYQWWERPRGHSKTQDAAAVSLVELVLGRPGSRIYFAATDQEQAGIAFDSLKGFVNRSPVLSQAVELLSWQAVVPETDSTLTVLPADAPGSWGKRPALIVIDELEAWRGNRAEEFFYALITALGKVPGARLLIASTAGWDRNSIAWKLREKVQNDPAWRFSRRGQVASWITREFLESQRRILPEHVYRMLHLNEWTEAGGAFLTYAEVQSIFDPDLRPRASCDRDLHVIGLDVGLSHDQTVACVVHVEQDGTVTVDAFQTWQGSPEDRVQLQDVEDWLRAAVRRYSGARVVADPWQAVAILQRLQAAQIRAQEVTFTPAYRGKVYSNLLELVRNRKLRCFRHEQLEQELLALSFVDKGGVLRVDHPSGGHDDHAMSLAIAALAVLEEANRPRSVVFDWLPDWTLRSTNPAEYRRRVLLWELQHGRKYENDAADLLQADLADLGW